MRTVRPVHPGPEVLPLAAFGHMELDVLRHVLRGSSVVDWVRLHFRDQEEIRAFLRVNGFEPDDEADRARLEEVRRKALAFLADLSYRRIPERIQAVDTFTLLELASGQGRRVHRFYACLTLKVMHIIHYTEAHELFSMLPISNAELAVLLRGKIEHRVRGLIERGFPIVSFVGGVKTPSSVIAKLLAKVDTQAAQVFDKLRFRFVVRRIEDIPPLLIALTRELCPFNYLVPRQSDNTLLDLDPMLVRAGNLLAIREARGESLKLNEPGGEAVLSPVTNEFSGPTYRVVHFIAEVPIRIDRVLPFRSDTLRDKGGVSYGTVEFQISDERTALQNESGENRHVLYKRRQLARVRQRLERGRLGG